MIANLYSYVSYSKRKESFCFDKFVLNAFAENAIFQVLALIVNIENASKFCQTLSMSMGALAGIAKAATFISFKDVFERLINDIQSIVATSKQ